MANILNPAEQAEVLSLISEGFSLRRTAKTVGVAKNTVMKLAALAGYSNCSTHPAANESTAYGRRRKWWIQNRGTIPDGMVVASSCGDKCCDLPEHCYLRPKIETASVKRTHAFAIEPLKTLGIGQSIGIAVPEGWEAENFRRKLRGHLSTSHDFYLFRWSVRLRADNVIAIRKVGYFGDSNNGHRRFLLKNVQLENHRPLTPPRFCVCGCGEQVFNGVLIDGHKRKELGLCPGCGSEFEPHGRVCCSRDCRTRFDEIRRVLECL